MIFRFMAVGCAILRGPQALNRHADEPNRGRLLGAAHVLPHDAIWEFHRMTCARPSDSGKLPAFKPMELSTDQFETCGPTAIWRWRETPSSRASQVVPTFSAVKG